VRCVARTRWSPGHPVSLLRLPMQGVCATPPAVFLELQPPCRLPLVLGRAVVAPLAVGARQRNDGPHGASLPWGCAPTPRSFSRGPYSPTPQLRAAHCRAAGPRTPATR
jgi:hypothetical protein